MSEQKDLDEFHGVGGAYVVGPDGVRKQVEAPTKDHPEGNGPRDRNGKLLVAPVQERSKEKAASPAPTPEANKGAKGGK